LYFTIFLHICNGEHSSTRKTEVLQIPHIDSQDSYLGGASGKANSSAVDRVNRQLGLPCRAEPYMKLSYPLLMQMRAQ
jgi:hypothetical protein